MELKYFRLIKTIVEEGNIANSAEKLFLTQSALSHQLRDLEQRLGFKVFYRSRNKWELTQEGNELYKTGKAILDQLAQGFQNIKQLQTGVSGTIKVSTECYSFYQGLPGFIQKMGLLYPEITIELLLEATHQPIEQLLTHKIDIAVVSKKPEHDLLNSVKIFDDEIYALLHKEHPFHTHRFLAADDFANIHLIIHSYPLETVAVHQHFLKSNRITPEKISAIPLTEVALEMVSANMGILCMPKWALKSFQISDAITYKKIGESGLKRTHYLVIRKSDKEKQYIHNFIHNFIDDFQLS